MRFKVVNLGCRVNRVESDGMTAQLLERGCRIDAQNPQVIVVNSCTVTGEAQKKTRKAVRHALSTYPRALVFVTGCAAAIDADEFKSMDARVRIAGKSDVVEQALRESASMREVEPAEGAGDVSIDAGEKAQVGIAADHPGRQTRFDEGFPTRAGIKIQDGCDNACTYCIVHVARGRATSVPMERCLAEAQSLADAGAREAVLTGINLGSYRDGDADLTDVLLRMRGQTPQMRLRLSSIEPLDVTDGLIDAMACQDGWICRHLHLPLQSGSSRVLQQMARPYDADRFIALVNELRTRIPQISLSTDIIVGFPGETERDFQQTLDVAQACRFSKIHVFRYSKRAGTPAAERTDQIDPQVIARRVERLSALGAQLRCAEAQRRAGNVEAVLVESKGMGMTESYFPVRLQVAHPRGSLIECTLTEPDEDGIFYV